MRSLFVSEVEKAVNERLDLITTRITGGSCEDYSGYRECVGYIKGLNEAIRVMREIENRYMNTEDED